MRVNVHTPNFLSFRQHTHTPIAFYCCGDRSLCVCLSSFETIYVYFLASFFLQVVGFLPHMGVFISLAGSWPTAKAFKLHTISFIILLFLIPSASLLHPALLRALLVTSTLLCVMPSCRYCWESGLCGCCHQVIHSVHICVCVLGSMSMCVLSAIIISWHDSVEQRLIKFLIK